MMADSGCHEAANAVDAAIKTKSGFQQLVNELRAKGDSRESHLGHSLFASCCNLQAHLHSLVYLACCLFTCQQRILILDCLFNCQL